MRFLDDGISTEDTMDEVVVKILSANSEGTLLEAIAATSYADIESMGNVLSTLHNSRQINILETCEFGQIDNISSYTLSQLLRVFCEALPLVKCTAADAIATCNKLFDRVASRCLAADFVYDALREWFKQSLERVEEGLNLARRNVEVHTQVWRTILLAGATYDAQKFTCEALTLSHHQSSHIRLDALWALGRVTADGDDHLLAKVIERFDEAIETPSTDQEASTALESVLCLLSRHGEKLQKVVEPLLVNASKTSTPPIRCEFARYLSIHRELYTEVMINTTFTAIQATDKHEPNTIDNIDLILYIWDLDEDRQRVFSFLRQLLSQGINAIEISALENFRHQLSKQEGRVQGWYVVSLLLTGEHHLCIAADQLLPNSKPPPDGLDIDLVSFALDPLWVLFLSQKILGYCIMKPPCAGALLLSCLRALPNSKRARLEQLVLDSFLINYPQMIDRFKTTLSKNDLARLSVKRLARRVETYLNNLDQHGYCNAFQPSDRERQIQKNQQVDNWRRIQKDAEQNSLMFQLVNKSVLLYGNSAIIYTDLDEGSKPRRSEVPLTSHQYTIELPRLMIIDPVGFQRQICHFRAESPPS